MSYPDIDFDRLEYAYILGQALKENLPEPWPGFIGYQVIYEPDGWLIINRWGHYGRAGNAYPIFPMGHVSKVGAVYFLQLVKKRFDYPSLKECLRVLIQSGMPDSAEWDIRQDFFNLGSEWSLANV